jgi:hypothetical protein
MGIVVHFAAVYCSALRMDLMVKETWEMKQARMVKSHFRINWIMFSIIQTMQALGVVSQISMYVGDLNPNFS